MDKVSIFWYRRDLRLEDNVALHKALQCGNKVIPVFIFDKEILDNLVKDDARVSFIYETLEKINIKLLEYGSSLLIKVGNPVFVYQELVKEYDVDSVFTNRDYEPYARQRDEDVKKILATKSIDFVSCKDQVIFEQSEVVKDDGKPYTVYTPYKNKWLKRFDKQADVVDYEVCFDNFYPSKFDFPKLDKIGFIKSDIKVKSYNFKELRTYDETRDFPHLDTTSYLSPYLRFGLVSCRQMVRKALQINEVFLSELIWREFFMQILWHFPKVITNNFKKKYDAIPWRFNQEEFLAWKEGRTGYPMVDAGMRELNETGYMHNRVRMITAGFLCKHLLIDWRLGEAYFAEKLLDYDLSANNGNWQWASGTGCDAAPYFRVFNPESQLRKFDKELKYVKKWIKDFDELTYPKPIVEHKMARERAIATYKEALN